MNGETILIIIVVAGLVLTPPALVLCIWLARLGGE